MCTKPQHGQLFDNRKRWCANCDKTVVPLYITCSECGGVWPEHVEDYLEDIKETAGYADAGVTFTWH